MQSTKSVTGPIYCCQISLPSASYMYYSWGVCLQESINERNIQFFMFKCPCSLMKHCLFAYRKCKLYSLPKSTHVHVHVYRPWRWPTLYKVSKFSLQDHCTKENTGSLLSKRHQFPIMSLTGLSDISKSYLSTCTAIIAWSNIFPVNNFIRWAKRNRHSFEDSLIHAFFIGYEIWCFFGIIRSKRFKTWQMFKYHDQSLTSHDPIILDSLLKLQLWGEGGPYFCLKPIFTPSPLPQSKRPKKPGFNQV